MTLLLDSPLVFPLSRMQSIAYASKSRLKIKLLTCGRLLCCNCAVKLLRGWDLCPTHARLVRGELVRQLKVLAMKKQR